MSINIAVLVKQIPDPSVEGKLNSDFRFDRSGKIVLDEADLYGVEVALGLIESAGGGKVTVVSMAPNEEVVGVRTALAMGADDAVVISDEALANSHALATAKVLNAAIDSLGDIDLVIAGTESSDGYTGTIPAQIGALRKISALTFATSIKLNGSEIEINRQSNEGIDTVKATLPAVVSVTAGVVEPRYPNFKGIMAAKSKPVSFKSLSDLGISIDDLDISQQKVINVEEAPGRAAGEKIDDPTLAADKIIQYLESAGVL